MQTITQPNQTDLLTVQAVIFDLDGVLMDSEWLSFEIWQGVARQYGGTLADAVFPKVIGTTIEETAAIVMRSTGITFDISSQCAWVWQEVIEKLKSAIKPLPGVCELVDDLARRGIPLAIASNSPILYIENALTGLNLRHYFPVRVGIDHVLQGKPAPDVYLRAASQIGVFPERCLAIEDSRVGVQAAYNAEMRVLAVPDERDQNNGFSGAWRMYKNLNHVLEDLDRILNLAD